MDKAGIELQRVIEAVLFASPRPTAAGDLRDVLRDAAGEDDAAAELGNCSEDEVEAVLSELSQRYETERRGFRLERIAGGYQISTDPECAPWVRVFLDEGRSSRLSRPALETLAIVAYRQPATRVEVEGIRGVNADGVLSLLLERGLVRIAGRSDGPGRPFLYGTTREFLEHFRLSSLEDLPEGQVLRRTADDLARRRAEHERAEQAAEAAADDGPGDGETMPEPAPAADGEGTNDDRPAEAD